MIIDPQVLLDAATGQPCLFIGGVAGDPNSRAALEAEIRASRMMAQYPMCPQPAAAPGAPPAPVFRPSPAAVALMLWREQVQLPQPQPKIAPGWALTGKPAYLETGATAEQTWHFDVFGYSIDIHGAATGYDVDWGDGKSDTNLTSQGGPWPNGDITHVYAVIGKSDVLVTQHWTATWTVGTEGGAIDEPLHTEGRIPGFERRQLQAVRVR